MKSQVYLADTPYDIVTEVNAKKSVFKKKEALNLTKEVSEIYSIRGKKVIHVELKDKPDKYTLAAVLLGPTGNLRAPTLRKGKTLIVGFNEEIYNRFFG